MRQRQADATLKSIPTLRKATQIITVLLPSASSVPDHCRHKNANKKKQHPTRHFREERVQVNSNKTTLKFTENKEDLVCSWEGCFSVTVIRSSRSLDKIGVERSDGGIHGVQAKKTT